MESQGERGEFGPAIVLRQSDEIRL